MVRQGLNESGHTSRSVGHIVQWDPAVPSCPFAAAFCVLPLARARLDACGSTCENCARGPLMCMSSLGGGSSLHACTGFLILIMHMLLTLTRPRDASRPAIGQCAHIDLLIRIPHSCDVTMSMTHIS